MRARTLILFLVAVMLAGGTGLLVRSWLAQRASVAEAAPAAPPALPQKSVLVARGAISRGQILKPADLAWQPWPETSIIGGYIQAGTKRVDDFAGWVAREPFVPGEPINEAKVVSPGSGGFLAAVLRPGMRAVSVQVNTSSNVSGFVLPGDQVDVLITHSLPAAVTGGGEFQHKAAETVLHDVRVLAVDQQLDNKSGGAIVSKTATLEVTPKQSEIIAVANEMGKLSLSLRSLVSSPEDVAAPDSSDGTVPGSFTLDDQVSRLLAKPLTKKDNRRAREVTILRGNGKSDDAGELPPASRGL